MSSPVSNLRRIAPSSEPGPTSVSFQEFPRRFSENPEVAARLSAPDRRYLQSLRAEEDPELLMEALLALGSRWENQGRDAEALRLYDSLLAEAPRDLGVADRVQPRAEALQGRGAIGARVEVSSRHFLRQAADPAMIFGFMVAGGVASTVRNWALGSLALRAEGLLTRGWVARAVAGTAAYGAELPALVGSTRLAQGVLGYEQGFGSLDAIPHELAGAALFLGALKLSGLGTRAYIGRASRLVAPLLTGAGTMGGIYVGHRLQESLGLRPAQDEVHRWFDTGETFLQLRIGGRLAAGITGSRSPLAEMAMRQARLETSLRETAPRLGFLRAEVRPYAAAAAASSEDEVTLQSFRPDWRTQMLQADLNETLGPRATSLVARSVEGIGQQMKFGETWLRLVRASQYRDIYGFELAMRRLNYVSIYARPLGLTGSYLNWVARIALESSVRHQDQARFDRLLRFLGEGGSIDQLEGMTAELEPSYRLFAEGLIPRAKQVAGLMTLRSESHRQIRELSLSKEARQSLHAYARLLSTESERVQSVQSLKSWIQANSAHRPIIDSVLTRARLSPVGAMRVQRMMNVVEHEVSNLAKLRELNDPDLGARGRGELIPALQDAELILSSQDDGYLSEVELARELSLLHRRMPDLFDAEKTAQRQARTRQIIEDIWPDNRTPFDAENIRRAFARLADPVSDLIEQDLGADRFRLLLMDRDELHELRRGLDKNWQGGDFFGLFIPAERDFSGRDSVYLQKPGPASNAVFRDQVFENLSHLVHEHTHFRRAANQTNRGLRGTYLEEMLAEALMLRWRAEQGNTRLIRHYQEISPGGLGPYLRDWVNLVYFVSDNSEL